MGKHSMTKHHRCTISHGGSNDPENISYVQEQAHRAFHLLFADMSPEDVARELNKVWISKNWVMVAVPNEIYNKE